MTDPYVTVAPGDLLTAQGWNTMQRLIREDIEKVATAKAKEITHVARADDAIKLGGNTVEQLVATITDQVLERIGREQGYLRLFKLLHTDQPTVVRHSLGRTPLVDVYQLQPFLAVCSEDDNVSAQWVTFYLHHTGEKQLTVRQDGKTTRVDIQPRRGTPYRIPFAAMLAAYQVDYSPDSNLGDIETDFWEKFFAAPNDEFDDEQYCHSPWFDRCCGERRTVAQLQRSGDWDDMWLQIRPRKTVNFPAGEANNGPAVPNNLGVTHFDPDTVGLALLANVALPPAAPAGEGDGPPRATDDTALPVMVLLKC